MHDNSLQITSQDIPTFNCIVHVSSTPEGVRARVANLNGIEFVARDERTALSKIVPTFKATLEQLLSDNAEIPWQEPPHPANDDEQTRYIPVHL
ncbi:MAG: hypothetical protein CMJ76_11155 [Planctomycetaceae bacterium]|nr:hypothetical protein [Planctomycetaceae bacterium]|tara:strand:+ start:362 stop:643 length:282 start_codon:yes stop_codon:yes gene_type:complete